MSKKALALFAAFAAAHPLTAFAGEATADPRLGAEVDRLCFARDIRNFRTIDKEDDAVLLERGVNDWYKATLSGACNFNQLRFAQSVAIDERPRGGCITRGDVLVFSDSAFGDFRFPNATRCIIAEIYRWDPQAVAPEADRDEAPAAEIDD
ncbi:MAG: DUF6491 family protein [Parvularculaceae bacterium]|nr:DUF6491 family protein [Parvularculaceae bacterium]